MTAPTLTAPAAVELPEPPAYDLRHRHSQDNIVGYDVILATWPWQADTAAERAQTTLTVVAVVRGAHNYGTALAGAQALRTGRAGSYAYPARRYDCGCREIAHRMTSSDPRHPAPIFHDFPVND